MPTNNELGTHPSLVFLLVSIKISLRILLLNSTYFPIVLLLKVCLPINSYEYINLISLVMPICCIEKTNTFHVRQSSDQNIRPLYVRAEGSALSVHSPVCYILDKSLANEKAFRLISTYECFL